MPGKKRGGPTKGHDGRRSPHGHGLCAVRRQEQGASNAAIRRCGGQGGHQPSRQPAHPHRVQPAAKTFVNPCQIVDDGGPTTSRRKAARSPLAGCPRFPDEAYPKVLQIHETRQALLGQQGDQPGIGLSGRGQGQDFPDEGRRFLRGTADLHAEGVIGIGEGRAGRTVQGGDHGDPASPTVRLGGQGRPQSGQPASKHQDVGIVATKEKQVGSRLFLHEGFPGRLDLSINAPSTFLQLQCHESEPVHVTTHPPFPARLRAARFAHRLSGRKDRHLARPCPRDDRGRTADSGRCRVSLGRLDATSFGRSQGLE